MTKEEGELAFRYSIDTDQDQQQQEESMESIQPITLPKYTPEQSSLHHLICTSLRKERFTDTYE